MSEVSEALTALQRVSASQTAPVSRFDTDLVRSAWSVIQQRLRDLSVGESYSDSATSLRHAYIEQLWTDHVIINAGSSSLYGSYFLRIPYRVEDPATAPEHVKFGTPEKVRVEYVAAAASRRALAMTDVLELSRRVRTQAGSNRYRKPIGSQLGSGDSGGDALATVAKAGSRSGIGVTSDSLRDSIDSVSKEKTYRGGKVFGDIGSEGKLKRALSQISNLSDDERGAAAAEVVRAAQALGLTRLVPVSVKRLYRQYISQSVIKSPAKSSQAKASK